MRDGKILGSRSGVKAISVGKGKLLVPAGGVLAQRTRNNSGPRSLLNVSGLFVP